MNFAYFRKSTKSFDETLADAKKAASTAGLVVGEELKLNDRGVAFSAVNPDWLAKIVAADRNLIGFVPGLIVVLKDKDSVFVGVSDPSLVGKIAHLHELHGMIEEMDVTYRKLVDEASAAGPRTITKIKLYSTASCQYCRMEKAFLDEKQVTYEQVMVDTNQAAAQEMVEKTGQMGVPVTEIIYDDGAEEYIIGFDKMRLSELLNIK